MRFGIAFALAFALAAPAYAGDPFLGVYFTQTTLTACDGTGFEGAITLSANVPDDGRAWTWSRAGGGFDGTNLAAFPDDSFALAPTAGEQVLENTGTVVFGPSTPGALAGDYSINYTVYTLVDGVPVARSSLLGVCMASTPTFVFVETELAGPACGPPIDACEHVALPNATFRFKGGEEGKLTLKASGAAAPPEHFLDPTLAAADGGATNATCFYHYGTDELIGGLTVDAAGVDAKGKPRWKRKAGATKATQRFADPKGEATLIRSLAQTSGAKVKLALTARGVPFDAFTTDGFYVQQRAVNPRDRVYSCTEVFFPPGAVQVDAAKNTVKAKMKVPACGPGCP
jgi:hypothetical protein